MEILKRTQHNQHHNNIVREIPIFIPITQTFWETERRIFLVTRFLKQFTTATEKRQTDEEK